MAEPQSPYPVISYAPQSTQDQEHLRILSICWYVMAGLSALSSCPAVIYIGMGGVMVFSPRTFGSGSPPLPAFMGWMFIGLGLATLLIGWGVAGLMAWAARSLVTRRRIVLIYVVAALACLSVPLGTVLGIFTFVVLARPNVRGSFR